MGGEDVVRGACDNLSMEETLTAFTPAVRAWFQNTFQAPTSPQSAAWPAIQRGEHTLILAPTGSGKTLAAFLWGIDSILRERAAEDEAAPAGGERGARAGVRLLYISPLKALNNDIERNLRVPLRGIRKAARVWGEDIPRLRVAVRSGDTPARERRAALKDPPDILMTTPESLYLLLTSGPARETLRSVRTVIVDEVHTLVGEKRGVHLSISLERLEELAARPPQRIGCSATIRPLEEAARFLGGAEWRSDGMSPRPVTVVDADYSKGLDLRVETVARDFHRLEGGSVWPAVIGRVAALIREHDTTLVFTNSRRLAERTADRLTEALAGPPALSGAGRAGADGSAAIGSEARESGLLQDGVARGVGMFAAGTGVSGNPIRAHHGSMSRESRLRMEADLKAGNLPALVGTSSLELGIDIGSVDLVVQLQSPKGVAQGLQRVGRSGHLVGQTSTGRIFATHVEDVMESAVIAGGMLRGDVEATYAPRNCLDVLAQQVVAMVAVEDWAVDDLFRVVRRSCPYEGLTPPAFRSVLDMLSGRYPSESHASLRSRLTWDRVNDRLYALPGTRLTAVTNGGTIPDRGAFAAYLPDGKTRIGELDEEFVFETRVGDAFMLGSQVWRVLRITDDRVVVSEAPGSTPRMPFWHGDLPWRRYELGLSVGRFRRNVAARLEALRVEVEAATMFEALEHHDHPRVHEIHTWLREDHALDRISADHVVGYVAAQLDRAGAISSDCAVVVEVFDDVLGDPRLVVQSPFGGRVHGPWALALAGMLKERLGREVEALAGDDGILLRIPDADSGFPVEAVLALSPEEARERVLAELPTSAVFGARFRQNAARALLLPGRGGGRRTPFWLQRLRAKELLQVVRGFPEFPVVAETYRECLEDVMDMPHLEEVLAGIGSGSIHVTTVESLVPSPVAEALLRDFVHSYMYEWDAPKAERTLQALAVSRELLQDILQNVALDELLSSRALDEIAGRQQHTASGWRARTADELAAIVETLGDLTPTEAGERATGDAAAWLAGLEQAGRVVFLAPTGGADVEGRWVTAEAAAEYESAFGAPAREPSQPGGADRDAAGRRILERFLHHSGPVTEAGLRARYGFGEDWLRRELERMVNARRLARGRITPHGEAEEYAEVRFVEQAHRRTMNLLREEAKPVAFSTYADLQVQRHHLQVRDPQAPDVRPRGRPTREAAVREAVGLLRGLPLPATVWERDVLGTRVPGYDGTVLEALCDRGEVVWTVSGSGDPRRARVRFLFRGEGSMALGSPKTEETAGYGRTPVDAAGKVVRALERAGALFSTDLAAATGLTRPEVEHELVRLTLSGLVTNDRLGALRHILRGPGSGRTPPSAEGGRRFASTLEAQLGELREARAGGERGGVDTRFRAHPLTGRRPGRRAYQAAKKRVARRLAPEVPAEPAGRWSLVASAGVMGAAAAADDQAEWRVRVLLERHGVVSRAALDIEDPSWEWTPILRRLQLLEMRGAVRRGYFVRGLPGMQFALPEVVERLREAAVAGPGAGSSPSTPLVVLNACDPANLYGRRPRVGETSDEGTTTVRTASGDPLAFPRVPSVWVVQGGGVPVLVAEGGGRRIVTVEGTDPELLERALATLLAHLRGFRARVRIETWDGVVARESGGAELLCAAARTQGGFLVV